MKSYSGQGIFDPKEAKSRRKWFDGSLEEWLDGKPFETKVVD